jgi:hypothetical protein
MTSAQTEMPKNKTPNDNNNDTTDIEGILASMGDEIDQKFAGTTADVQDNSKPNSDNITNVLGSMQQDLDKRFSDPTEEEVDEYAVTDDNKPSDNNQIPDGGTTTRLLTQLKSNVVNSPMVTNAAETRPQINNTSAAVAIVETVPTTSVIVSQESQKPAVEPKAAIVLDTIDMTSSSVVVIEVAKPIFTEPVANSTQRTTVVDAAATVVSTPITTAMISQQSQSTTRPMSPADTVSQTGTTVSTNNMPMGSSTTAATTVFTEDKQPPQQGSERMPLLQSTSTATQTQPAKSQSSSSCCSRCTLF